MKVWDINYHKIHNLLKMKNIFILCVFIWFGTLAWWKLKVFNPQSLRNRIDPVNGNIEASIGNFGLVSYGHSIAGRVWYDDKNADGCHDFTIKIDGTGDPDDTPSPIVLVHRGNWSFVQKARNVERAGGSLAIVINKDDDIKDFVMVDDGSGSSISIPSMLITKSDGDKILKELSYDNGTHSKAHVSLIATFDIANPDNRVEWDFWYSSSNTHALLFLRHYREWHEKLGDKTLFTPHFSMLSCTDCEIGIKEKHCYCDGKYCAIDESTSNVTGKEILDENLRQMWLYKDLQEKGQSNKWWDYVLKMHALWKYDLSEDCSKNVHKKLGLSFEGTNQWVELSFKNNPKKLENTQFEEENEYAKMYGPHYFPAIVVNNVTYRGSLQPRSVFYAICEGFKNKPEECLEPSDKKTEGITTSTLLLIIFGLLLLNILVIIIYKRYTKKEMDDKIEMDINSAVSQYFALQDKNNGRVSRPLVQ